MQNKLIVVTGPTGSGKTTVTEYLRKKYNIVQVITHTTRPPRSNEQNGEDYYFETNESFQNNHYLEQVEYSGFHYGSSYEGLRRAWAKSPVASIVLDTAGAITYANKLGDEVAIVFLHVTNVEVLKQRLLKRGDNVDAVEQRLKSPEYKRDLHLPEQLKSDAIEIANDDWQLARSKIDNLVKQIKKEIKWN